MVIQKKRELTTLAPKVLPHTQHTRQVQPTLMRRRSVDYHSCALIIVVVYRSRDNSKTLIFQYVVNPFRDSLQK